MRERKTTIVNGLQCSYLQAGAGKPLVLLHGWAQSARTWTALIDHFPGYALYAPDMPGFGESDVPPLTWTVEDYARWVHTFIEILNLKNVVIVGHSFGGRVAAEYAKRYPLKKLVIIASGGVAKHSWFRSLNKLAITIIGAVAPVFLYRAHATWLTPRGYADAPHIDKARARRMLEVYGTTHTPDETLFTNIPCPTFFIYGSRDWIARPQNDPFARTIAKAGHFPHITHTEETAQHVHDFL